MLKVQNWKKSYLIYKSLTLALILSLIAPPILPAQDIILNDPITIKFKKLTVNEALLQVSKKTNYYFTFDGETFDANKIISVHLKNKSLKNCLDQILNDPDLYYIVIGNHIVINKKNLEEKREAIINDTTINIIELYGKVIDKENNQSLAYAAVGIENHNIGSITNSQGLFILRIPKELIVENLCISFIGYQNFCISVEQFYGKKNIIELQRDYISVQEVIIRGTDAKTIIREANRNTKNNFSTKANLLTTFYRESVKQKNRFMFFSEAVLKVYKAAYTNTYDTDLVKVLKSRSFHDVLEKDTVRLKLKSGLNSSLSLDLVKNKIDFIDEDNFHLYNYKMVDIISYNNHPAYVIEFKQKEIVQDALYIGQLYIDIDKLAIIGAEFSINPGKINKVHSRFIVKKERGIRLRVKQANYRVSYHEVNGKYYLRHVKGELKFRVKKKRKLFATTFETCLEMAVCSIDTINVQKPKRKETDKLNTIFVNDIREYDNTFWEDYNFIKPDDNWQEAIKKLKHKLEQQTSLD